MATRAKAGSSAASSAHSETLKTIDEVRRLLAEAVDPDELAARAAEVRQRLRAAVESLEDAAVSGGQAAAAALPPALQADLEQAEQKIRENPLGAVLVAAGLGFLVGILLRR